MLTQTVLELRDYYLLICNFVEWYVELAWVPVGFPGNFYCLMLLTQNLNFLMYVLIYDTFSVKTFIVNFANFAVIRIFLFPAQQES